MFFKIILVYFVLMVVNVEGFVKRDAPSTAQPNILDTFQKNINQIKNCLDQTLASTADEVNTKQIQPVFALIGDNLNRVSKAFEDLTAPKSTQSSLDI